MPRVPRKSKTATTAPAASPAKPKRLLRRSEVSARAGFTVETLSRWAAAGHGPKCIMVGRCARYPEDEFERWIESLSASTSASE